VSWRENPSDDASEISELCREILDFWVENPGGRDTFEGIVEWWLLERYVARETERVRRALARLVAEGKVVERAGPDGQSHYLLATGSEEPTGGGGGG